MPMQTNYKIELKNRLAHYIVSNDEKMAVGEYDRQFIVGLAGFRIMNDEEAHLINIAVRDSYCHRGIGQGVLISLNLAIKSEADIITLEVRASNHAAKSLYI